MDEINPVAEQARDEAAESQQNAQDQLMGTEHNEQPNPTSVDPAYEDRRRRILDHRAEAQREANTLTACLAGVNSDLFDFQLGVGEALRQVLASGERSLAQIERHSRSIELMLKLSKQIAQFSQLELQARKKMPASGEEKKA
jgi:hypothetical protein